MKGKVSGNRHFVQRFKPRMRSSGYSSIASSFRLRPASMTGGAPFQGLL
jgi:hypothetical protein